MRELETSLQQFGEFILRARLVKDKAGPLLGTMGAALPDARCLG
jgi:hypothetical protein